MHQQNHPHFGADEARGRRFPRFKVQAGQCEHLTVQQLSKRSHAGHETQCALVAPGREQRERERDRWGTLDFRLQLLGDSFAVPSRLPANFNR